MAEKELRSANPDVSEPVTVVVMWNSFGIIVPVKVIEPGERPSDGSGLKDRTPKSGRNFSIGQAAMEGAF